MDKLKQLINYKGKRIRLWHRRLLIYWGLLLALPFVLLLVGFHWRVTVPLILVALESSWYVTPFILPATITLILTIMGVLIPMFIIKNSIFNSGFFTKYDKVQTLSEYLFDNDLIIRRKVGGNHGRS